MMSDLRITIKFFSKSNYAVAMLRKAHVEQDITQGLVAIGKTRFTTKWTAAIALKQCIHVIKELVTEEKINSKVCT